MAEHRKPSDLDPMSGFCASNGVYYPKRELVALPPPHQNMDITTFLFSHNHNTHIAFVDAPTGRSLSYATLRRNVETLAAGLHLLGILKGDVVLVLSPNSIHIPSIHVAILSLGAILTTANPLNTEAEIRKHAADSNPALVFAAPEVLNKARVTQRPIVIIEDKKQPPPHGCVASLHELLQSPIDGAPPAEIKQQHTATLFYSSGTTGKPKGVVATHRNYIAMVEGVVSMAEGDVEKDVCLLVMPLFHVAGFFRTICSMAMGETVVVMPKFDLGQMLWSIEHYRITCIRGAPPIFVALAKSAIVRQYDLTSLQRINSGGAPLGKEIIEELRGKFPSVEVGQGYGLTESCGAVTFTSSAEEKKKYGTSGLLAANMEAKIVDTVTGKALPPNQRGELWLRGPPMMKGYYNNEEASAATLDSEGWLKTGDLCYIDEGGFLFVVDRIKELIKYKAFQVAPAELEELLLSHPEIADCAVIPYPDDEAGQIPMACIVRKSGSKLKENDVMSFASIQVAPYKKIRRVAFVNSIPKSQSGKILRKDLIQQILATSKL